MAMISTPKYTPGVWQNSAIQRVYWGKAADSLAKEVDRLTATKCFIIASETLATKTDEIQKCEKALATKHAGTWYGMRSHSRSPALKVVGIAIWDILPLRTQFGVSK